MVNYKRTMEQASHLAIEGNHGSVSPKRMRTDQSRIDDCKEERLT